MPDTDDHDHTAEEHSRRSVLKAGAVGAVAVAASGGMETVAAGSPADVRTTLPAQAPTADITLRVNGVERPLTVESRVTLLDALRERVGLAGTKKGCDRGECGACTVLVEGERVKSCMTLAVMEDGREITTIEGLAHGDELRPVQAAFIRRDAFQCGFCTSGQIMSAGQAWGVPRPHGSHAARPRRASPSVVPGPGEYTYRTCPSGPARAKASKLKRRTPMSSTAIRFSPTTRSCTSWESHSAQNAPLRSRIPVTKASSSAWCATAVARRPVTDCRAIPSQPG